jgi:hypothetical protein
MGRKRKATKEKRRKRVSIEPIVRESGGRVTEPYKILEALVAKHHKHLLEAEARIAMAWDTGPAKPDVDGFVKFGRVKRGADIDRAFAAFDFWVVIRREVFDSFDSDRKHAEIDRLLCRCAVTRGSDGEIVEDEKDRSVFRLRKPVEVFPENVARYGFHQEPKLAECLARFNDSKRPLLDAAEKGAKKRGRKFSEPAKGGDGASTADQSPAGNGQSSESTTNGHTSSGPTWREVTLDQLEIPEYVNKALTKAGLWTLGELDNYEQEHGGMAGVPGLTDRGRELLTEAIKGYKLEHQELFDPELMGGKA